MKKIGPAKKIILLRFCPKKILGPDQKPKPSALNIKWTVPKKSGSSYVRPTARQEWTFKSYHALVKSSCRTIGQVITT